MIRRLPSCWPVALLAVLVLVFAPPESAQARTRSHTRTPAQAHTSAQASGSGYCTIASRCASLLIDGQTGDVLMGQDPDKRVYPASLTKVMTLYLFFEAIRDGRFSLTDTIPISSNAAAQSPTKIGLSPGSRIMVEDAIEAIAIKSANDIAVAVAEAIAGNEDAFARRMNAKASELGLRNTFFRNPSGLPDNAQHTTARDMVLLAQRILGDFPNRRRYFGLPAAKIAGRMVQGHNRLLKRGECTGGKTGYIRESGFNLLAWKEEGGRLVIGAVFGGNTIASRDRYMADMLRYGADRLAGGRRSATAAPVRPPSPATADTAEEEGEEESAAGGPGMPPLPHPRPAPREAGKDQDVAAVIANLNPPPSAGHVLVPPARPTLETLTLSSAAMASPTFNDSWAIQVGAYRDAAQAQQALARATRALPVILGGAFPRTISTTTTMGQLHRAQLIGLDEQGAKAACATLTREGMQCLAVPPGQAS